MPVSEAQKKASAKYLEKLDEIRIRMPKGKKDTIQAHAEAQGQSINAYINTAIDEKMSREATEAPINHVDTLPSENSECVPAAYEARTESVDEKAVENGA